MNGVKYHRIKKGLTQRELARLSGVSIPTVLNMEQMTCPHGIYGYNYLKIQDVLNVSMDMLIRNDYLDDGLEEQISIPYPSKTENPDNCITKYRRMNNLTFKALAQRLGVTSRECARKACAAETPLQKHLISLATYEDISVGNFIDTYSTGQAANY